MNEVLPEVNSELADFVHRLTDISGDILRAHFGSPHKVEHKADASPVTEIDRAVEKALRDTIMAHYPDHGITGEEWGNHNPDAPWQWVIDPIDGTRAFIAGYPTFTTLIALCFDSVPVMGVIDQPISCERFIGIKGRETRENNKAIHTRKTTQLCDALIATTSTPYYFNNKENVQFEALRTSCAQTIIGGDGYGYAKLASGYLDLFVDTALKPYDFCALATVIEGAGGVITDWDGNPLTMKSNGQVLAAANGALHEQALRIIQQAA